MMENPKRTRVPGFTAEFSLYAKTESYRIARNRQDVPQTRAKILPQMRAVFVRQYPCADMADGSVGYCTMTCTSFGCNYYGPF